jgi:hypothetical protein
MDELRVLVCGGRNYSNIPKIYEILDILYEVSQQSKNDSINLSENKIVLIQGGAKGADRIASMWAKDRNVEQEEYEADWTTYGKSAGFIRNSLMLKVGKPDMVIAFSGGVGTKMMIDIAKKAGVPVEVIEE